MSVLRFILESSKPYRKYLWGMVFGLTLIAADRNIKPYLIKSIIDTVSRDNYENIALVIAIYIASQFSLTLSWALVDMCSNRWVPQLTSSITRTFTTKIASYPHRFFVEHLSGSTSNKINDAAMRTPNLLMVILIEFYTLTITLIISIIVLARVHYAFAMAAALWISLFLGTSWIVFKKAKRLSALDADAYSKVSGRVVDFISNMFSVKLFASLSYEQQNLNKYLDDFIKKKTVKNIYLAHFHRFISLVFSFYIIGCLFGMLYLSKNKMITSGDFALVFMLNFSIVDRLFQLSNLLKDFINDWGTVAQALDTLKDVVDIKDNSNASELLVTSGRIVFDKVKFHYNGAEPLFQNKSITIEAGQKVGLVGYSGGGKSTFANLILRLYEVTDGRILIDEQNICNVTQDSLRRNIAMIPQDPSLFHRSIMENIHYGRIMASEAEVVEAAKRAHAHEFISQLPQGYNSLVGERGVKLSGGQRQRIAIARAILKNAPILILDEATSQLDSVTESYIQESLWNLMQDKTTIVIAHRLSTLLHMDRILVFNQGKIIEDGTHEKLLAKRGFYTTLWNAQVGGLLPNTATIIKNK